MKRRGKRSHRGPPPARCEVRADELEAIVERAKEGPLSAEDIATLSAAVETFVFLTLKLEAKGTTIERLRRWLFGASTEKTSSVVGDAPGSASTGTGAPGAAAGAAGAPAAADAQEKPKPKGHGKNGAATYVGAEKVNVPHASLAAGGRCPECGKGKVYPLKDPAMIVRVRGMAPLLAKVYELEQLRCNLCGDVFTAEAPEGVGREKYDETAAGMIGLLKYGTGLPFNRLARLEGSLGIPLPPATQWEVVCRAAKLIEPAHDELVRQAAQGEVVHNDDTTMKILEFDPPAAEETPAAGESDGGESGEKADPRTGVFTTGIVATGNGHRVALFFTGKKHAGENLADVLAKRAADLAPPIQMSDALSRNAPGDFETILANCNAHARRRFVDVVDNFPEECRHVLETIREVYKTDAVARSQKLSPEERLRLHQVESGPRMEELDRWMREQLDQRKVEPNSGLGEAMGYMLKHWTKLTLFLRVAGAPLDNNICERALKKAILHRKNAYFYKTENGARVGDVWMSLIHTAELNAVNPFTYLVALQRHHEEVAKRPADWMPWNYEQTLARLTPAPALPL